MAGTATKKAAKQKAAKQKTGTGKSATAKTATATAKIAKTAMQETATRRPAKTTVRPAARAAANAALARATAAKNAKAKAATPRGTVAKSPDALSPSQRIDRKIAALGDWRGARLAELRTLIHDVDPEVVEDWKWMGTPVWSHAGMYVLANAHKDKVKLTFFHGAKLRDPAKLFNAGLGGGTWRAIDIREADPIDTRALKALLREAIAYNAAHPVPRSKGSRGRSVG